MSKKIKNEQKKFLGETLNQYDKALDKAINQLDKKNREQNHKISSLVNSFDNEYLEKDVEGNMTTLENSKDGMVIINEIQGNTEVNYCKDGEKELILNGDIDTQGKSFVTLTEGVDGGLVDVSLEGNTEVNLSNTKDPVLVTREFDDINCNSGKLQYTIDDVTTINDEPGKVDIDKIVGDTMVNHAVNGSEELILNAHINESGDNNITLNGVTSDGGKVDVALEGNTLVNVSNVRDDYITPSIEDKVDQGSVISLPEVSEGLIHIDEIEGNTLVNYCTDGAKELTLNGDIDVEGISVATTEGVDNGLVDVALEGNTLVNLMYEGVNIGGNGITHYVYASSATLKDFVSRIKTSTTYTIIIYNAPEEVFRVFLGGCISELEVKPNVFILTTGENKVTAEPFHFYASNGEIPSDILSGIKIAILEGDYTDKEIPQYFEGMKSVGQDDTNGHKIEIVSQNKNLFDGEVEIAGYPRLKRTVNFIKVKPNTAYISNQIFNESGWSCVEEYDNNFNLINDSNKGFNTGSFTTLENTHYIKLKWDDDYDLTNVMVVEGNTVPTEYIPHSSNKKEILLNEPLRGLPNGIKDRFVKIGGKWFIERNLSKVILNGTYSENVRLSRFQAYEDNSERKTIRSAIVIRDFVNLQWDSDPDGFAYTMNDKYLSYSDMHEANEKDEEFCCTWDARGIVIQINKSKLSSVDEVGFNSYLQNNPVEVIYRLATPVYEPLEIEPTLNTYNDTTYISNNSIIPCNMQIKNTGYNAIIKPSTLYTVALYTNRAGTIGINLGGAEVTTTNNVATITTPETLTDDGLRFSGKNINSFKIMLLEGDRTNRLPNFFEGMKSSFEDKVQEDGLYKMKILMSNKNLVRLTSENAYGLRTGSSYIIHSENSLTLKGTTSYSSIKFKQKLKPLTEYHISCDATLKKGSGATIRIREECLGVPDAYTVLYNSGSITVNDKVHINGTFTTKNVTDIAIYPNSSWDIEEESELLIENLQISEVEGDYVESKSNEIQLSSIEPLRGVGDVHDRLVSKDGKLMIERNCGSATFDGSDDEKWSYGENYYYTKINNVNLNAIIPLCDKFIGVLSPDGVTYPYVQYGGIPGSRNGNIIFGKTGKTYIEFKQWLQQNPTTVVYQLAEPTYEEIPYDLQKIILESYNNGTLFIDTNIPPTKVSFNCFEEELTYLYPSTSYTLQFISDRVTTADVNLGGTQLLAQNIVYGINRITITTPETLANNKLVIDGTGANIREIVVTDTDRDFGYFEGMKSVGECEDSINILSCSVESLNFVRGNYIAVSPPELNTSFTGWYTNTVAIEVPGNSCISWVTSDKFYVEKMLYWNDDDYINYVSYSGYTIPNDANKLKFVFANSKKYPNRKAELYDIINDFKLYVNNELYDWIPKSNTQTLTHEPLRAVGDIKDKYVLIDGKWYIERNCAEVVFDGSEDERWGIQSSLTTNLCSQYYIRVEYGDTGGKNIVLNYINDTFKKLGVKYSEKVDKEGMYTSWQGLYINIFNSKLSEISNSGIKQWLQSNPVTVVYELQTPTYEEVDYNPFEVYSEVTHISNNSTIPCNMIIKNHGYNTVALKENTQYTLYVNKNTTNALTYRLGDYVEINSLSKFAFTTPATLTDKTLRITGKGNSVKDLMLIEGTPANDPVGYFNGLKSSYECEKVTDESDENYGKYKAEVVVTGKNKWNGTWTHVADTQHVSSYIEIKPNTTYKLKVYNYNSNDSKFTIQLYDKYKKYISFIITEIDSGDGITLNIDNDKCKYIMLYTRTNSGFEEEYTNIEQCDIQLEEGDTATEYEPYFESKQTIYLNSPLLKGDEIVWKDNKIQHYHKMETIVLDGSNDENWIKQGDDWDTDNRITFKISLPKSNLQWWSLENEISTAQNRMSKKVLSDKFTYIYNIPNESINKFIGQDGDIGHFGSSARYLVIGLLKAKLQTQNVVGFKQWLQQNPITVAYQLAEPTYEEISDYPLKLNVIANSSLSTESTIQVTNISFNIYEETLPYLYPNTKYYITFNADVDRNNIIIDLGGNHVVFDCKVGFNKVEITTPSDTTNLLTFSGTGVNIDHVKVTQQDIDEYFEGMKSVGECENNTLEIICKNNDNSKSNTQTLTHEPLRSVGDIKDKYVLIDGKWYIERNCGINIFDENISVYSQWSGGVNSPLDTVGFLINQNQILDIDYWDKTNTINIISEKIKPVDYNYLYDNDEQGVSSCPGWGMALKINKNLISSMDINGLKLYLKDNPITIIYKLVIPTYEPIDYNPFEVYSDITHITTNSLIPTNVVVKNHGYNCILKPSTKYTIALNKPNGTISAKLGGSAKVDSTNSVFTITTPSTLNDNVLRLSGSGNVKDIMVLEGDKTVNTPSYFKGIESVFEQEYDTEKGKYRVTARVEGDGKESNITFYINEPLRGVKDVRDRVFIQDGKVVVQRNCTSYTFDGSDDEIWVVEGLINKTLSCNYLYAKNKLNLCSRLLHCDTLPVTEVYNKDVEGIDIHSNLALHARVHISRLATQDSAGFKQWLQQNPVTVVYELAEPVYELADCDLSKLVLENYENSSLIFESNIPVSANIRYSGEVPVVTQAKTLSSQVDNTTLDINENIIPYMCDIDYRIVELQLMNGDTQGEGIELLGIGDIEILSNENVLFNNREDKKYNYSYDMLKRDILSQRYSREEYQYRLDRYLLANKISDEEYKELEGLLHNGE